MLNRVSLYVILLCTFYPAFLSAQARQYVEQGWDLLDASFEDTDSYFQALELFGKALTYNSRYDDAYHGLASAYLRMENYEEAARANKEAIRLRSNYLPYRSLEIRILIQQYKFDEAKQLLSRLLLANETSIDLLLSQADIFYTDGMYKQARASYESILTIDPTNLSALISMVYMALENKQNGNTEQYLERLLANHSNSTLVLLLANEYYLREDQLQKALFYAEKAYERSPESAFVLSAVIQTYIQLEDLQKSISFLNELLTVDPENVLAWYGKGRIEHLLSRPAEALGSYTRSLRLDPFFEASLLAREVLLIEDDIGSKLDPILQEYTDRARILQSNYQYKESEFILRRALRMDPYNISLREQIAGLHALRKNYPQYLNELEIMQSLGDSSQKTTDSIESLQSFLGDGLAAEWGVTQFDTTRPRIAVHIFYTNPVHSEIPGELELYAWLLEQSLYSSEHIDPLYYAQPVANLFEAVRQLKDRKNTIVLLLHGGSNASLVSLEVDVALGQSGVQIGTLQAITGGKYPAEQAILQINGYVDELIPRFGRVLEISGKRTLLTLGKVDGLERSSVLTLYRAGTLVLDSQAPYIQAQSSEIGTLEIQSLDALIAEGTFVPRNTLNSVDIGDITVIHGELELPQFQNTSSSVQEFLRFRVLDNSLFIR